MMVSIYTNEERLEFIEKELKKRNEELEFYKKETKKDIDDVIAMIQNQTYDRQIDKLERRFEHLLYILKHIE